MNSVEKSNKEAFLQIISENGKFDILSDIVSYLEQFEHFYDNRNKVFPLHMTGLQQILSSVLDEKVSTTPPEVLAAFYEEINSSEENQVKGGQDFTTFKSLTLIDKLSLCQANLLKVSPGNESRQLFDGN